MAVRWSHVAACWEFTCLWGCYGFDYESEIEAEQAFLAHECKRGVL